MRWRGGKKRAGQEDGARARWRRETRCRYRQLILRFEEPQIGRGLNWSSGSRNRIARATPAATYSARPRGSRNPISRFLRRFSSRALPPVLCPREGTGPPRYAAFVPLNQHVLAPVFLVLVAGAPVAENRIFCIRVFPRPIFRTRPRAKISDPALFAHW